MSDLTLLSSSIDRGLGRQATRSVTQIIEGTAIQVARVRGAGVIQTAKLDALGAVGGRAQEVVALSSQNEAQLGQIVPLAVSRLQAIGDTLALAATAIVADTAGYLRQL